MAKAKRYYTKNETTGELEWLKPPILVRDGEKTVSRIFPSPEQWAAHGAYPRDPRADDPPPTPPEGKVARPAGWEVVNGSWVRAYEFVDAPLPTLDEYDAAMETHLRMEREARGYTTREPDSYYYSQNARWAQDARDWIAHKDAVMEYALTLINAVQSGQREPPTMEEFCNGLPQIAWTYTESEGA